MYFLVNFQPILVPGSVEAINKLKEYYDLVIVTSRQLSIVDKTIEFINKNFPNCFKDILFGNHYGDSGEKVSKEELCKKIGAFCLVDDSLKYSKNVCNSINKVILFGDYPWNKTNEKLNDNIIRCETWNDVVNKLIPINNNM